MNEETKDFWGVSKLIDDNGGIEHFRCFAMLPKFEMITPFGFAIVGDKYTWVECLVSEARYKVSDGYKITLVPASAITQKLFGCEHYEQSDFMQLVKCGSIIVKTDIGQKVEHVRAAEHLCGSVYLIHEGDVVV